MAPRFPHRLSSLIVIAAVATIGCGPRVTNEQHAAALQKIVEDTPDWVEKSALGKRLWKMEREFYESRQYLPAWVDGDQTTPQWKDLVQQLKHAERHGLDPASYGVAAFEELRQSSQTKLRGTTFAAAAVPELDARMTYAYLRYAADLIGWTRSPKDVHTMWLTEAKNEDLAARLQDAVTNNRVRATLEELAPDHPQYRGLQAALASGAYDADQVERITMNMERWRWAPRSLGDRYVLVNVPSYWMQVMEGDTPVLSMRVIVGEPENQTPLFSDEMTYVVFSPYWNVPPDILMNETLPRVARDPDFLRRNNMEVVGTSGTIDPSSVDWSDPSVAKTVRIRQRPGADNALGNVKFIFPNHFNVYLHDTPTDKLFNKETRTLSHGCIRVEQPLAFAKYVLRDQPEWTEPRIVTAMGARQERTVTLKHKLPVHIGYWTAWVEEDGKTVTFTDDPYGIDGRHLRLRAAGRRSPVAGSR